MNNKEWIKIVRTIVEIIAVTAFAYWSYNLIFKVPELKHSDRSQWIQRDGFIALSYGGISRTEAERRVARDQFNEHVRVLIEAGYEVITDDDIVNFYANGAPLPDKALFLMFEGGRKDSAIFGHDTLEEFGIRATMFIQTERLDGWNRFFIRKNDLSLLSGNPCWSIGSQGYDLRHINIMPDEGYSFFLTDFLRNIDKEPIETHEEFIERISEDYKLSFDPLREIINYDPKLYIFMPANMMWRSLDGDVEAANAEQMKQYYRAAFTREGPCYNSAVTSCYNMTRMQVQPDWTINRILMEIDFWSPHKNDYIQGEEAAALWSILCGALVTEENHLILTAPKDQEALCRLKGSDNWENLSLSFSVPEPVQGVQSAYLRYTSPLSFLRISVARNLVTVHERVEGKGLYQLYSGYIREQQPWNFNILMRGNRVEIKVNDKALYGDPLPVTNQLRKGSVALGVKGENAHLDGRFNDLRIQPFPVQWARLSELFADDSSNLEAVGNAKNVALIVPIAPDDAKWAAFAARAIFYGAGTGEVIYAELPEGELDLSFLSREWLNIPPVLSENLWKGVVFVPLLDRGVSLSRMNEVIHSAKEKGLIVSLRLSEQEVRLLADSDIKLDADYLLLPSKSGLPQDLLRTFGNRYNLNNVLSWMDPEAAGVEVYRAEK
ncbi:MAG: hypothetical protein FWF87_03820 [Synergistaceae bacterium]|nr:hypothetical protein [Synergistaceae bacterium]